MSSVETLPKIRTQLDSKRDKNPDLMERIVDDQSRVRTGHGKPGKSWNFIISFSRPGKS